MKLGRLSLAVLLAFVVIPLLVSGPNAAPRYSPWSQPANLGGPINGPDNENAPTLSKDGVSLYFSSNRPCGDEDVVLDANIWVAQRDSPAAPWNSAICLTINVDGFEDSAAAFSRDGHWMFFVSDRPGGVPGVGIPSNARDIWVSWRADVHDDDAWTDPVNAGIINSNQADAGPTYFENDVLGWPQLLFTSNRNGTFDIWAADVFGSAQFGTPSPVDELNTSNLVEARPSIRHDGLELFFFRTAGAFFDLYAATRVIPDGPWSEPVNLAEPVNSSFNEQQPAISPDRRMLFFASNRPGTLGGLDIWVSTRAQVMKQ
jgi:hypothetical protein